MNQLDELFPTILPYEHTDEAKQRKRSYETRREEERALWIEVFRNEYFNKDKTTTSAADWATEVVEKFRMV